MRILAISGSLRADSSNMTILNVMAGMVSNDSHFVIDDHIARLPHFIPGGEIPEVVTSFFQAIDEADAVLFCSPEYAHGMPGVLKNALDWTVASGNFYGKVVGVITASSQGEHGHAALLQTLKVLTATIPDGGALLIPFIRSKIDGEGRLQPDIVPEIAKVLAAIINYQALEAEAP